jgi:hypothetical protein
MPEAGLTRGRQGVVEQIQQRKAKARNNAARQMITLERSSSRWSTTLSRSS